MIDHKRRALQVSSSPCGLAGKNPVYLITLVNDEVSIELTNLGSTITAIYTADRKGIQKNIVAGFRSIEDYKNNQYYFGCVLGRYTGRIAGAKYTLGNQTIQLSINEGQHHLHGGVEGFSKKIWKIKSFIRNEHQAGVVMEYFSEDGEEGYPGNLWVKVTYTLNHLNELKITYEADTDKSTPVNLSNHSYFNLSGFEQSTILNHSLQVNADRYTEKTTDNIPTGEILSLAGNALDFSQAKEIAKSLARLPDDGGLNHNYVLRNAMDGKLNWAAGLREAVTGRIVNVYTDQPGIQVYTANDWTGSVLGPQGYYYYKHGAIALETQNFSDAPNRPGFPDPILKPGDHYFTSTVYQFTVDTAC